MRSSLTPFAGPRSCRKRDWLTLLLDCILNIQAYLCTSPSTIFYYLLLLMVVCFLLLFFLLIGESVPNVNCPWSESSTTTTPTTAKDSEEQSSQTTKTGLMPYIDVLPGK